MEQRTRKGAPLSLRPHYSTGRIHEIWSDGEAPIGYVINGRRHGPNLMVMGSRADCVRPFWRLLIDPRLLTLRGKLVLLFIDGFDDPRKQRHAAVIARMVRPLKGSMVAPFSGDDNPARCAALIKGFCRRHGMMERALDPVPTCFAVS